MGQEITTVSPQEPSDVHDKALDVQELQTVESPSTPGVFAIDSARPMDDRVGATLALDDEEQNALPMVVWLRGDESWFGDFDLNADEVMERLHIKRSRLTQISGKDLRVGRVRSDRYIRPIYRSVDVDQYLSWTRATASHQKSSAAIKEAAQALHQQGEQIAQIVAQASVKFSEELNKGLVEQLHHATTNAISLLAAKVEMLGDQFQTVSESQSKKFEETLADQTSSHERTVGVMATQIQALDLHLDAVESTIATATLRMSELSDKVTIVMELQQRNAEQMGHVFDLLNEQSKQIEILTNRKQSFKRDRKVKLKTPNAATKDAITQQKASKTKKMVMVSSKRRNPSRYL